MIQQADLRIGNIVHSEKYKRNFRISEISKFCIVQDDSDYTETLKYEDIFGVEITPEILLKCGFDCTDITKALQLSGTYGYRYQKELTSCGFLLQFVFYKKTKYDIIVKEWREYYIIGNGSYDDTGEMDIIETCKYLHQLQNLYYSLTGTELKVEKWAI